MIPIRRFLNSLTNAVTKGKPNWSGGGGVFSFQDAFQTLGDGIVDRGLMNIDTIGALALISGADSRFALVQNVGLFAYNPMNGGAIPAGSVPANSGGRWELLISLVSASVDQYTEIVGDGVTTIFKLTHNLNTFSPSVVLADISVGLPYLIKTSIPAIRVDDANSIELSFPSAPLLQQYNVTVKK